MSKEIIFKAVLDDSDYKQKLEQIGQASDKADDGVRQFSETTKTLGTQLRQGVGFSEFKKGADEVTSSLQSQKRVVEQIEQDIKDLNKQLSNTAPGKVQQELQREVNAANKALREETAILKGLDAETKKLTTSKQSLTSRARQLRNELVALELAGKRDTQEFRNLSQEAAKLNDAIGLVGARTRNLANDLNVFQAFSEGVQGVTGAFAAAQGAAALFGKNNEDIGKALLKVQGALAVTNGLQQVFNALKKESTIVTLVNTKATVAASTVMKAFGVSVNTTATSFKVLRGAIIATGLGAVVAIIGAIVSKLDSISTSANDSSSSIADLNTELQNLADRTKEIQDQAIKSLVTLAVAQKNLTAAQAQELLSNRDTQKVISEILINRQKLINDEIKIKEQLLEANQKEIDLAKEAQNVLNRQTGTGIGGFQSNEAAVKREQELAKERERIIERSETVIADIRAETDKQIGLAELINQSNISTAKIDEAKKFNKEKKKINDEFEKLAIAIFESSLDEEEKLFSESNKKRVAAIKAFESLTKKEQEQQRENLAAVILQIEKDLQDDLTKLNRERLLKTLDDEQKAIDERKKLRLAALDEEAQEIENNITSADLLRTGTFKSELEFTKTLIDEENKRYENEKKQLNENRATQAQKDAAELKNKKNLLDLENQISDIILERNIAIFNQSVDAANSFFNLRSTLINKELSETQRANQQELENFKGTEEEKARLQARFDAQEREIKNKAARADRDAAVFNAIINTAVAVTKALATGNIPLIALAAATGALQIAAISAQPLPRFEKGGLIKGKSHKQGGTLIEAEKDEFVVNKHSTRKHKPFVEAINKNDGSFERLIFKKFILPETLGLDKKQNILVNASLKSDKLENEMRKNRKQEIENTKVLASLLKSNQSLSTRFKW